MSAQQIIEKQLAWLKSLESEQFVPSTYYEKSYRGTKQIHKAIPYVPYTIGQNVLVGDFVPEEEIFPEFETTKHSVADKPTKLIKALGTIVKITTRTIHVKIGKFHIDGYKRGEIVIVPYTQIGLLKVEIPNFKQ